MSSKEFPQLASQAQSGDQASLKRLLFLAHTPVSYQCRKLLQNKQAATDMTKEILQKIHSQLHTLNQPELFEKWLGHMTAKHCMRALRQGTVKQDPPPQKLDIPNSHLDEQETAMVADQIVDALPDDLRICIILYCCCKIPVSGISRLTSFAESDVKANLSRGQAMIKGQLQKLHRQGVQFAPVASLPGLLQTAMHASGNPKAATAMVNGILGIHAAAVPVVPKRPKTAPALKLAVAVVSALLVLMGGLIFFLERNRQAELEMAQTTAATEAATQPTQTATETTAPETTAETTMETTAETTVATTTETTEATTEATTQPATEPAAQPQQTQGSQTVSSSGNTASAAGSNTSSTTSGNTSSGAGGNTASAAGGTHVHSYQDAGPIGVISAGCESPGSRLKICFVCGDQVRYTDAAGLPPHGHSYSSKVKAPTEGSEGFTIHTCTRCGKTYMDNYVPKLTPVTQPPATQAPPAPQPEVTPDPQTDVTPET